MIEQVNSLLKLAQEVATATAVTVAENANLKAQVTEQQKQLAAQALEIEALKKPAPTPAPPAVIGTREPFIITKGGTYNNIFVGSESSTVAPITIATSEEVILGPNVEIHHAGYAVVNHNGVIKTNLKADRVKFKGLPHTGGMSDPRRCFSVNNILNLDIQNCESELAGFLTTQGEFAGSGTQGIRVLYNKVRNIQGLTKAGRTNANFVQIMNNRGGIPNVEIAYNAVLNEYGICDVEDNINIYNARGRAASRMQIHSNLIVGAFYHPTQQHAKTYSGGGIITDGAGDYNSMPAYIDVYKNSVIGCGNYHLGMANGRDLNFYDNIALSASILPNGKLFHTVPNLYSSGIWANQKMHNQPMSNNFFKNNTVGVNYYDRRNDISIMLGATATGTIHLPGIITKAQEQAAIDKWQREFGHLVGVK